MVDLLGTAELGDIARGKHNFDVAGHYALPDVFRFYVNERPMPPWSRPSAPTAILSRRISAANPIVTTDGASRPQHHEQMGRTVRTSFISAAWLLTPVFRKTRLAAWFGCVFGRRRTIFFVRPSLR